MMTIVGRMAIGCFAVAVVTACRSEKAPISEPARVPEKALDPGGPSAFAIKEVGPPQVEGPAPEAGGPDPAEATGRSAPTLEKDRLWSCYQEVYCAQKKGEMDRILGIYRQYGFQNPQDFTSAWIEAAKDTEWVSRLANEVSKACK